MQDSDDECLGRAYIPALGALSHPVVTDRLPLTILPRRAAALFAAGVPTAPLISAAALAPGLGAAASPPALVANDPAATETAVPSPMPNSKGSDHPARWGS